MTIIYLLLKFSLQSPIFLIVYKSGIIIAKEKKQLILVSKILLR